MDMLKQLNAAIEYIESNLCAEFDLRKENKYYEVWIPVELK